MSVHIVGLLPRLFVSPQCPCGYACGVFPSLCESARVSLLQGGSVGAGLGVPVLF